MLKEKVTVIRLYDSDMFIGTAKRVRAGDKKAGHINGKKKAGCGMRGKNGAGESGTKYKRECGINKRTARSRA